MIRTKIVAVPKGSATSVFKSNNGSSSISPSPGSGSSSSGGDSTKYCLWQTGDSDSSIISKGSDDETSNMLEVGIGQYNKTTKDKTSFSVGNGSATTNRSNAFEVQNDGTAIANTFQSDSVNTSTINSANINNSANITNDGNITNTGDFDNKGNITNTGTLKTADATVDNDLTVGKSVTAKTVNGDVGNIKEIHSDNITNMNMIKTKDLTVTGSAHFFELVIDKIKAAGGAALFTAADGFDVDVVEPVENGYKLYWICEANGKVRQNMWKVNDQAICMSFNQAKIGTSYNVSNKYYWSLVTAVSEYDKPVTREDGNKYNWIIISTVTFDGTVNPEIGDSIAMLGYRGTDDEQRQSAIYITAYASFDKGVEAPFIAQYKGIKDFDIEKYRTSWWSLKTNKFVGDFVIESSGQNVLDFINDKIKIVDDKIDESVSSLNTTITDKYSSLSVTLDGINTKVGNNTTSITKLGENLDETNKNLGTTNSNITALEKTVQENYSTLDQKVDGIVAKVTSNTDSITKLGNNLETTNGNITKLENSVNDKYAELTVKADRISSKVEENTTKITTLGTNLETTNSNISALETTVEENYSKLDQKADGISTKVSNNTTTITKIGENLNTTNENVTSLTKTVQENYSTLDQKADSISTTVSSHTQIIEGLDGRVTTNTENISKINQTADGISSRVTKIENDYVTESEMSQTADRISLNVYDNLKNKTGIDVTTGKIVLDADNVQVKGNFNLTDTQNGMTVYDVANTPLINLQPKQISKIGTFKNDRLMTINLTMTSVSGGSGKVVQTNKSNAISLNKGDVIRLSNIHYTIYANDGTTAIYPRDVSLVGGVRIYNSKDEIVLDNSGQFGRNNMYGTYQLNTSVAYRATTDDNYTVNLYITIPSDWTSSYTVNGNGNTKIETGNNIQTYIGSDGAFFHNAPNKMIYSGEDELRLQFGFNGIRWTDDLEYYNKSMEVLCGANSNTDGLYSPLYLPFYNFTPVTQSFKFINQRVANIGQNKYAHNILPSSDKGILLVDTPAVDGSGNYQETWFVLPPESFSTRDGKIHFSLPVGYTVKIINNTGGTANVFVTPSTSSTNSGVIYTSENTKVNYLKLTGDNSMKTFMYVGGYGSESGTTWRVID